MKRAVRLIIPFLFAASGASAVAVADATKIAPAIAFGNHFVFALQLFLLIFYALLLLVVPLLRGVCQGELPIELTARGARFPEPGAEAARALLNRELRHRIKKVEKALEEDERDLDRLADATSSSIQKLEAEMKRSRAKRWRPRAQLNHFFPGSE